MAEKKEEKGIRRIKICYCTFELLLRLFYSPIRKAMFSLKKKRKKKEKCMRILMVRFLSRVLLCRHFKNRYEFYFR